MVGQASRLSCIRLLLLIWSTETVDLPISSNLHQMNNHIVIMKGQTSNTTNIPLVSLPVRVVGKRCGVRYLKAVLKSVPWEAGASVKGIIKNI